VIKALFFTSLRYVFNVAKRSIWDQCNIKDRPTTDLCSWKSLPWRTSNDHISITVPRLTHALRYSKTNGNCRHRLLLEFFSFQFLKACNILWTSGRRFLITTSTQVTISIILNGSQLDVGSLIQTERNEKDLRRIQKKMMHARSTLDWSQFNNISCDLLKRKLTQAHQLLFIYINFGFSIFSFLS